MTVRQKKNARKKKMKSRVGDKNCAREKCCRGSCYRTGRHNESSSLIGRLAVVRRARNRRVKRENFRSGNDAESYVWFHEKKRRENDDVTIIVVTLIHMSV